MKRIPFKYAGKYFFGLIFAILIAFSVKIGAQGPGPVPVFASNKKVRIISTQGSGTPAPNRSFLLSLKSVLGSLTTFEMSVLATTNANGEYEVTLPCYIDANGNAGAGFEGFVILLGSIGGGSGSGAMSCSGQEVVWVHNLGPSASERNRSYLGPNCASIGKPVSLLTGNMWMEQTDFLLPGIGESIRLHRTYNSDLETSGVFGPGWTSDFDESLSKQLDSGGQVIYLRQHVADGRTVYFLKAGSNLYRAANPGFYDQIVGGAGGTWTLNFKDGRQHHFHANGRLDWKRDRNGNQTTFNYSQANGQGDLLGITDAFGRTLSIVMSSGRVSKIYDSMTSAANPIATYQYNSSIVRLESVSYQDGSRFDFEYDLTTVPGRMLLTSVKDALGNVIEKHAYDSQGRATTSEQATDSQGNGGQNRYVIDYSHWSDAQRLLPTERTRQTRFPKQNTTLTKKLAVHY